MAEIAKPRWFHLTPDRLILALLAVEGLLWLSDRLGCQAWHKGYAVLTAVASAAASMLLMLGWCAVALLFRWRFQFSIRSLLLLVVVVAIPCSWMAVAGRQKEVVEEIRQLGGLVQHDYKFQESGNPFASGVPPGPTWLRDLLGEDFFATVVDVNCVGSSVTNAGLEHLKGLTQLKRLELSTMPVTDAGLGHLKGLTQLEALYIDGTRVSDAGLVYLKGLTQLQNLELKGTHVTDASVKKLQEGRETETGYWPPARPSQWVSNQACSAARASLR
jgi:hypothetical protein